MCTFVKTNHHCQLPPVCLEYCYSIIFINANVYCFPSTTVPRFLLDFFCLESPLRTPPLSFFKSLLIEDYIECHHWHSKKSISIRQEVLMSKTRKSINAWQCFFPHMQSTFPFEDIEPQMGLLFLHSFSLLFSSEGLLQQIC